MRSFSIDAVLRDIKPQPSIKIPKPVELLESELHESFVKGSGPGGQKINKCRHCVQLKHLPTGIFVETQRFRELSANRKEARKLLKLKLDLLWNGSESKLAIKAKKIKKNLAKRKARANAKYNNKDDTKETDDVPAHDPKAGS